MSNFINVFQVRQDELVQALLEHIQISFIALFFAVIIAVPLGIYLTKKSAHRREHHWRYRCIADHSIISAIRVNDSFIRYW